MSKILSIVVATHDVGNFPKNVEVIFADSMKSKNRAIKNARGKYLAFINSQDLLAPNFFKDFVEIAQKYSADIVHARKFYRSDGSQDSHGNLRVQLATKEHYESKNQIELLPSDRESRILLLTGRQLSQELSGNLFRRKFLTENQIEFVANSDLLFSIQTLLTAKIYICIDAPSYIHRNTPENFEKFLIELMNQIPIAEKILKDPVLIESFISQLFDKFRGENVENLDKFCIENFGENSAFIKRLIQFALRPIVQVAIQNEKFFAMK